MGLGARYPRSARTVTPWSSLRHRCPFPWHAGVLFLRGRRRRRDERGPVPQVTGIPVEVPWCELSSELQRTIRRTDPRRQAEGRAGQPRRRRRVRSAAPRPPGAARGRAAQPRGRRGPRGGRASSPTPNCAPSAGTPARCGSSASAPTRWRAGGAQGFLFARDALRTTAASRCRARQPGAARAARGRAGAGDAAARQPRRRRALDHGPRAPDRRRARARPGGVVCTFADVTSSVEAERALREERDRAQRYLEVASTLVVVLDDRGSVELINRQGCELLGFAEDELRRPRLVRARSSPPPTASTPALAFTRLVSGVEPPGRVARDRSCGPRTARTARSPGATRCCATTTASVTSVLRSGEDVTERRARRGAGRLPRLPRPPHRAAEPRAARGAARAATWPARAAPAARSRSSTSTSTTSSSSTTRSATRPATRCCARPRGASRELTRAGDVLAARAATSSCCCSTARATRTPPRRRADGGRADRRRARARRSRSPTPSSTSARRSASRCSPSTRPTPRRCFKRADAAMYQAKRAGRRDRRVLRGGGERLARAAVADDAGCAARSTTTSCACTTSRSVASPTASCSSPRGARALGGPRARPRPAGRCSSRSPRRPA